MIERLIDFVTIFALETSCEASARIMQAMHVKISGDTVCILVREYRCSGGTETASPAEGNR